MHPTHHHTRRHAIRGRHKSRVGHLQTPKGSHTGRWTHTQTWIHVQTCRHTGKDRHTTPVPVAQPRQFPYLTHPSSHLIIHSSIHSPPIHPPTHPSIYPHTHNYEHIRCVRLSFRFGGERNMTVVSALLEFTVQPSGSQLGCTRIKWGAFQICPDPSPSPGDSDSVCGVDPGLWDSGKPRTENHWAWFQSCGSECDPQTGSTWELVRKPGSRAHPTPAESETESRAQKSLLTR